jgi:DNA polymerase III epsilon subunit-like protein
MRRRTIVSLLVLFAASACSTRPGPLPPYVQAAEARRPDPPSPAAAPDQWLLAFIDIETTGLVPGWHEMIDIGIALATVDGRVVDTLFLRIQPEHPERLSAGARAVNAFDAERWQTLGALAPGVAIDSILAFHRRVAGSRPTLMVAFNSQFDAAFLDHLFRSHGTSWREMYHYFVLDLPSMAWSLGLRDLRAPALAERLGVPDEPHVAEQHTGISGAMVNVRIYRALLALRD